MFEVLAVPLVPPRGLVKKAERELNSRPHALLLAAPGGPQLEGLEDFGGCEEVISVCLGELSLVETEGVEVSLD